MINIKDVVELRNVNFLCHFTRFNNIESILSLGLITRSRLHKDKIDFVFNDSLRLDGHPNSVCCSIMYPNYKMFYSLRMSDPEQRWSVVCIDRRILWEIPCLFCKSNAASREVTSLPESDKKGASAFLSLFEDISDDSSRKHLGIPEFYPTNPQAEVLVLGDISKNYILGVSVDDMRMAGFLKQKFQEYKITFSHTFFRPRIDYEFWR